AVAEERARVAQLRLVHDVAREERAHEVQAGDDDERRERQSDVAGVGAHERPEAAEKAQGVRLAHRAFLVKLLERAIGAAADLRPALRLRAHDAAAPSGGTGAATVGAIDGRSISSSSRAICCSSAKAA